MVEHHSIHLGHALKDFLTHQGLHMNFNTTFTWSFIMRPMRGMGILECLEAFESVSSLTQLGIETHYSMGMIIRCIFQYILISSNIEETTDINKDGSEDDSKSSFLSHKPYNRSKYHQPSNASSMQTLPSNDKRLSWGVVSRAANDTSRPAHYYGVSWVDRGWPLPHLGLASKTGPFCSNIEPPLSPWPPIDSMPPSDTAEP